MHDDDTPTVSAMQTRWEEISEALQSILHKQVQDSFSAMPPPDQRDFLEVCDMTLALCLNARGFDESVKRYIHASE